MLTAAAISSSSLPITAIAANYGGFGSSYAEVIDPKTAVLNDENLKSEDVKAGLDGLLNLIKIVGSLKESLVIIYIRADIFQNLLTCDSCFVLFYLVSGLTSGYFSWVGKRS